MEFLLALAFNFSSNDTFTNNPITFNKNVLPIFQSHCASCHPGVVNYKVAYAQRDKIMTKLVNLKKMPPQYISTRLTDGEINLVKKWINSGAKQ